jgi:hypothetical protein
VPNFEGSNGVAKNEIDPELIGGMRLTPLCGRFADVSSSANLSEYWHDVYRTGITLRRTLKETAIL